MDADGKVQKKFKKDYTTCDFCGRPGAWKYYPAGDCNPVAWDGCEEGARNFRTELYFEERRP